MKNIHVIPTDKPSRLFYSKEFEFFKIANKYDVWREGRNIYITSDEEIKKGDWFIENGININKWKMSYSFPSEMNDINKKVILTTDVDLIKDGVQAIDDEFLEWFVKNPSCEFVRLKDSKIAKDHIWDGTNDGEIIWEKEIIIPKEDPNKETLEEAVNAFKKTNVYTNEIKQKQERSYSEEEVYNIVEQAIKNYGKNQLGFFDGGVSNPIYYNLKKWFEQFKKSKK